MTTPAETTTTTNTANTTLPAPSVNYTMPSGQFTAEDIEKARAEERDKLYNRISRTDQKFKTLEEEMKSLKDARDADLAREREAREAAEAEAKRVLEDEMSARQLIESRDKEWQDKFDMLQQQQAAREAILEKERQYARLQAYIQRRVNEERDEIAEELVDYIGINVNTEEEAEASIQKAIAKSAQIWENISKIQGMQRGVGATGFTPGVIPTSQQRELTPEEIKAAVEAMSTEEYGEYRKQIGLDRANTSRGIFG